MDSSLLLQESFYKSRVLKLPSCLSYLCPLRLASSLFVSFEEEYKIIVKNKINKQIIQKATLWLTGRVLIDEKLMIEVYLFREVKVFQIWS